MTSTTSPLSPARSCWQLSWTEVFCSTPKAASSNRSLLPAGCPGLRSRSVNGTAPHLRRRGKKSGLDSIIVTQMSSRASKSTEKRWCTSLHHWRDFRWKLVECDWCLVTSIRQRLSTLHWLPPLITSEQSKCSCRSDRWWAPGFNERRHRLVNTVAHALSRSWTGRLFYAFRNKHV